MKRGKASTVKQRTSVPANDKKPPNTERIPLSSAPPPYHTVGIWLFMCVVCAYLFPTLEHIDHIATVETFTYSLLFSILQGSDSSIHSPSHSTSLLVVAAFRLLSSAWIFYVVIDRVTGPGIAPHPSYRPKSKLLSTQLHLRGAFSLFPFTWWCVVLLGCSFALSGVIPLLYYYENYYASQEDTESASYLSPWLLRAALLSFEVVAPCEFLVATVVKYALWPHALRARGTAGTAVFRSFHGIFSHNVTVILILMELIIGGIPVAMSHVAVSPIFGLLYVLFTWCMSNTLAKAAVEPVPLKKTGTTVWKRRNNVGPQFLYFFMDTTLGWTTSIALIVLLVVLLTFYAMFSVIDNVMEHMQGGLVTRLLGSMGLVALVCRFRD